jgi:hypothetical protein
VPITVLTDLLRGPDALRQSYRGPSPIRKDAHLGPCSWPMPRLLEESYGGGRFVMGEVPLYASAVLTAF